MSYIIAFWLNVEILPQSLNAANLVKTNLDSLLHNLMQKTPIEKANELRDVFVAVSEFAGHSSAPINVNRPNQAYDIARLAAWLMSFAIESSNFANGRVSNASARLVVMGVTSTLSRTMQRLSPIQTPAQAHLVFATDLQACLDSIQEIRVGDFVLNCSVGCFMLDM